jgi:hypothetical protein
MDTSKQSILESFNAAIRHDRIEDFALLEDLAKELIPGLQALLYLLVPISNSGGDFAYFVPEARRDQRRKVIFH